MGVCATGRRRGVSFEKAVKGKDCDKGAFATYDSIRVRDMFMALMAARHSSRAPTLSAIEKRTVDLTGVKVASVHLWR